MVCSSEAQPSLAQLVEGGHGAQHRMPSRSCSTVTRRWPRRLPSPHGGVPEGGQALYGRGECVGAGGLRCRTGIVVSLWIDVMGGGEMGRTDPPRASSDGRVRCQASAEARNMPQRGWAPVGAQGAGGSRCASGGGGSRSGTVPPAAPRCLRTCGRAGRQPGGARRGRAWGAAAVVQVAGGTRGDCSCVVLGRT